MTDTPRDRLRELLDAVLDDDNRSLAEMAGAANASPFHFGRSITRDTGESPMAMRRRVLLERAAWQLAGDRSVTDAAWGAGYESVEGFSRAFARAFGRSPGGHDGGYRIAAPNGIHFHPPMSLWVDAGERGGTDPVVAQLVAHDLDDTRALLSLAADLGDEELDAPREHGGTVTAWDGPERSIRALLTNHVHTKEVWLAAIDGEPVPERTPRASLASLHERHESAAGRWLAVVQDLDRRGGWDDRLIDALCDPPESFVMSSVVAHVLTYAAHRRLVLRRMLAECGVVTDAGDPIDWLRRRRGED